VTDTEVIPRGLKPRRRWLLRAALLLVLPALVVGLAIVAGWHAVHVGGLEMPGGDEVFYLLTDAETNGTTLTHWNWHSGKRRQIAQYGQSHPPSGIVVSPDRRWLATGGPAVTLYDAQSLKPLGTVELPFSVSWASLVAVSDNGQFLLLEGSEGVCIVESATLRLAAAITTRHRHFRRANSWSHQVVEHASGMGIEDPTWRLLEFEEGRLNKIAEGPTNGWVIRMSHDRSYAYDRYVLSDLRGKTQRLLGYRPSSYCFDFAPAEQQIAIPSELGVYLVDCPTGELVRRYDSHGEQPTEVVFSWDGRQLAAATDKGSVFVWDVASGDLLAADRPHHRFLVCVAVVTAAAVAWGLTWVCLGLRERSVWWTVADLAVVAGLALFGFFARWINNWWSGDEDRIPAVASLVVLLGTSVLFAVGLVFGRGRWPLRVSAALVAFTALWAWPTVSSQRDGGRNIGEPIMALYLGTVVIAALVAGLLSLVRWRGWWVAEPDAALSPPPARLQFTLRDLLLLTAAVAVTLLLAQQMPLTLVRYSLRGLGWLLTTALLGLTCFTQVLVAVAAFWTALSQRPFWQRVAVALAAAAVVAAAPLALRAYILVPIWSWFRGHMLIGVYIFAALMLFRLRGFRLVRVAA
jgi:hypothetical protein